MKKLLFIISTVFILAGCSTTHNTSKTSTDIENITQRLNSATSYNVSKSLISINNQYTIETNNGLSLDMSGRYINMTGDVFTLKAKNKLIGQEKQIKRWGLKLNRLAELRDESNNIIGYIGEDVLKNIFSIGYRFYFYDENKNEIGHTKQEWMSLTQDHVIYNNDGSIAYTIKGKFVSLSGGMNIKVKDNSKIRPEYALYYACIAYEIAQSESD